MHVVWSLGTGGTELVLRKLILELADDFEHVICTVRADQKLEDESARVICLGKGASDRFLLIPKLIPVLRREKPDVVHSRNWSGIEAVMAAKAAGVPLIIHSEHGRDQSELNGQPWRRRFFRHLCYRSADVIFAVSGELRTYYARQAMVDSSRIRVIPNGVDTARFRPLASARAAKRRELGFAADDFVIGTLGRFDPVKNHGVLIEAAGRCISRGLRMKLLIVGTGTEKQKRGISEKIEACPALKSNAIVVGEVKDVPEWLNAFDIFVLPSITEGMSNTLLEAMAAGIPAIASKVGGNPELVREGISGLLFDPLDANGLAERCELLYADHALRSKMSLTARQDIEERFGLDRMMDRYSRLYSNADLESTCDTINEVGVGQTN